MNCKFKKKLRHLYLNPNEGLFWNEGEFLKKHDIGGTNFWPVEYFDMVSLYYSNTYVVSND